MSSSSFRGVTIPPLPLPDTKPIFCGLWRVIIRALIEAPTPTTRGLKIDNVFDTIEICDIAYLYCGIYKKEEM